MSSSIPLFSPSHHGRGGRLRWLLALWLLAAAGLVPAWAQRVPAVNALQLDADAGLQPGSQLQFRVEGTPGGRAELRVAGTPIVVPLRETAPGIYRGVHTVRRVDRIDPLGVMRASISAGNYTTTHDFSYPPAFMALAPPTRQQAQAQPKAPAPAANVLGAPPGPLTLQVLNPSNNATIDTGVVQVRGRTAPNTPVRVRIDAVPPLIGQRLGVAQQLMNETVQSDAQGNFSFNFDTKGMPAPGTRYEMVLSVGSGNQAAEARLVLLQRG